MHLLRITPLEGPDRGGSGKISKSRIMSKYQKVQCQYFNVNVKISKNISEFQSQCQISKFQESIAVKCQQCKKTCQISKFYPPEAY